MLQFHLDPVGGMAGDMFVAAMLDLRPDLEAGLQAALALCPLIETVSCRLVGHDDGILTGRQFLVARPGGEAPAPPPHRHDYAHPHDHHHAHDAAGDHGHVDWRLIRTALQQSGLDAATKTHSIAIFTLLAEAEARIHGRPVDDVAFHEVGAWDSIADIVSAGWLIAQLAAERWTVGAIPLGGGRVRTAHGLLPVPAPATTLLLEGFTLIDDGIGGERVTPTGAAILAYLCRDQARQAVGWVLRGSGHGFGTRRLPGVSNCLRVMAFEAEPAPAWLSDTVAVLEFEIDDQTAEDIAAAAAHLRALDGVLDVVQAQVFGKKGRVMTQLRILAKPAERDAVLATAFNETTTLGIRHSLVQRAVLRREKTTIDDEGRVYTAKTAERPAGRTAKIEAGELAGIAGAGARAALRARLENLLKTQKDGS